MIGMFQGEVLRIELEASMERIRDYLVDPAQLRQWVWPQTLDPDLTDSLQVGQEFYSRLGSIPIGHRVERLEPGQMHLVLWGAADGFCQWSWGNGWVQLRTEAVSLLPVSLGQTLLLQQLHRYATDQASARRGDLHTRVL